MSTTYSGQALIVAVDIHSGCYLLGSKGFRVEQLVDGHGCCELTSFGFDEDDIPRTAGLHVWEGGVTVPAGGDGDFGKLRWRGRWRVATLADFAAFGLAVPAGREGAVES